MAIKWVTQVEACEAFCLSKSSIQKLRNKDKILVIGKHYRRKTPTSKILLYNLEACDKTLSKLCSTPLET
tara:strand:+ start:1106 stop:1315 length:210 start_codon:yes stop_codon:yes gene_type:complete